MKLLLLTYQGDIAGSTFSIAYLAKGLAARGHQVYVGCRRESLLYKLLQDSKAHPVAMQFRGKFDRKAMTHLKELVKTYDIELINAQSSKDRYLSIFARWLHKLPVKLVHTRRQKPESIGGWLQNTFYVKGTDKIVVISDELKNTFVSKGFPADHLQVIYNGLPRERFEAHDPARTRALRRELGLSSSDTVIGCVGRRKKQEQLLEALQYLPAHYKVIFVGIKKEALQPWFEKLPPIRQQLFFTGAVAPEEAINYYPLFNVNVLPSTMDGFGLVLVEAMGMGIPVIGTNAQGIKNVIEDGVSGLLFEDGQAAELAQKIRSVLDNPALLARLIKNGKYRAENTFSMEHTVKAYEAFFASLIREG